MAEIKNLIKRFGDKTVFNCFSALFSPGIHAICGESGAGKTTLLRILAGLEKSDGGEIHGFGKISIVFQEPRLLPWYTAGRNIEIVSDAQTAASLLGELRLSGEYGTFPSELSGGMQKRVSLARALAAEYDTLLLDEPFTGLDAINASEALEVVRRHTAGRTVLLVTHDSSIAAQLDSITQIG